MKLSRKIEVISNLAIIVVAILLSLALVKSYLWPTSKNGVSKVPANLVGKKLTLPGIDWTQNGHTLIMALQVGCHFCSDSAPFYKELINKQSLQSNVKLVAVLPNSADDAKSYLDSIGVTLGEIKQAPLNSIGVSGTPTLLMVDGTGTVTDAWLGRLDSAHQAEVLSRF